MRKVFLFLATAALFASCSDDLLEPNNGFQAQDLSSKGITFQVVKDDPATRGIIEKNTSASGYSAYFFAEKDRISIWSKNAQKGWTAPNTWTTSPTLWTTAAATYKATKSQGNPNFTAIDDGNLLGFKDYNSTNSNANKADFFVAYPTGQSISFADDVFTITPKDLRTQSYDGYMNMDSRLMYDYIGGVQTTAEVKEKNKSVGEKVDMTLQSPLSTILFKCTDVQDYYSTLGGLKSITITSQYSPLVPSVAGTVATEGDKVKVGNDLYFYGNVIPADYKRVVTRADGKNFNVPEGYNKKTGAVVVDGTAIKSDVFDYSVKNSTETVDWVNKNTNGFVTRTAKLIVSTEADGKQIRNDEEMNLFVLPVNHKEGEGEIYTIAYEFKNATLTYDWPTYASFGKNSGSALFPFNIAENFDYIVTNAVSGKCNLIVNKGALSAVFNEDKTAVNWGAGIDPATIDQILINSGAGALTDEEFALLNKFTNATSLKIKNHTTKLGNIQKLTKLQTLEADNVTDVADNAFAASQLSTDDENLSSLQKLILPKVTNFPVQKADDIEGTTFSTLTDLDICSYAEIGASGQISPDIFFNTSTRETLEYIDISALTSLQPTYDAHKGIFFEGYSVLEEIHLNSTGVKVNDYQFKDCYSLEEVTGAVDLTETKGVFSISTTVTSTPKLATVNLACEEIPEESFSGSVVKNLYKADGKTPIQPTSIGKNAFDGNTAIVELDLSAATTIGVGAFNGATAFKGNHNADVTLRVQIVEENAFNGTAIIGFYLVNAESTKKNSLNSSALERIKYGQDLDDTKTGEKRVIATDQVVVRKDVTYIFIKDISDKKLFTGYKSVTVEK